MKKILLKNEILLSALSLLVFCVFAIFAISSDEFEGNYEDLFKHHRVGLTTDGRYYEEVGSIYSIRATVGHQDKNGEWHGKIERSHSYTNWEKDEEGNPVQVQKSFSLEVEMVHGRKHGMETITFESGNVKHYCYWYGKLIDCEKSAGIANIEKSAFTILQTEYPIEHAYFNLAEFDDTYLQNFFNGLNAEINKNTFGFDEFDEYYEDAIWEIEETEYDSLLQVNNWLTNMKRMEMLKNNVFRLATLERNRTTGEGTFNILKNTYPGYVDFVVAYDSIVEDFDVTENGFRSFCNDYDAKFDALSPLNVEDPFFVDSINNRMYRVIGEMYEESSDDLENKSAQLKWAIDDFQKPLTVRRANEYLKSVSSDLNGLYIQIVLASMVANVVDADVIQNCVKKAWILNNNIVVAPSLATLANGGDGSTKATVSGSIFEDGGSDVTARGIVWAEIYNPTTENNQIESGSGLGEFLIEITGLEKNTRYFARTYAVSDVGITYGNCVEFSTAIISGSHLIEQAEPEFDIFPNPAVNNVNLRFSFNSTEKFEIIISNLQGQTVLQKRLGVSDAGSNIHELDISELKNGMYICTITNGTWKANKRFVVSR